MTERFKYPLVILEESLKETKKIKTTKGGLLKKLNIKACELMESQLEDALRVLRSEAVENQYPQKIPEKEFKEMIANRQQ